jgi:hypothetical protein
MFTSGRLGAFVATSYYLDIYLEYKDVEFILLRVSTGQEKFSLVLRQQWRKGKKELVELK